MDTEIMEFFAYARGRAGVLSGRPNETLREVLVRGEFLAEGNKEGFQVFLGECATALELPPETENGADNDEPVDIELTLEVLELRRHRHVHVHHCHHVAVTVNFTGEKKHRFSPSTAVETVTRWARKKFGLSGPTADDFVLQLCNSDDRPPMHEHLSQIVHGNECSICFDLVKEGTPKG